MEQAEIDGLGNEAFEGMAMTIGHALIAEKRSITETILRKLTGP